MHLQPSQISIQDSQMNPAIRLLLCENFRVNRFCETPFDSWLTFCMHGNVSCFVVLCFNNIFKYFFSENSFNFVDQFRSRLRPKTLDLDLICMQMSLFSQSSSCRLL